MKRMTGEGGTFPAFSGTPIAVDTLLSSGIPGEMIIQAKTLGPQLLTFLEVLTKITCIR
jgi:hypothetical protein